MNSVVLGIACIILFVIFIEATNYWVELGRRKAAKRNRYPIADLKKQRGRDGYQGDSGSSGPRW